ncbi:class I adenylate-forming enzyme family protein [Pelagerythrobacter marensis]|uniref:AMP-dependent synthetase/ligase n=1 Tax=Pelagerythrobacter marensis TaxID=543877 RepID=A0A0G3XAU4_9SPHN|nr:class I adenylate-forming enzyme family protein [Pelagerythrobacter marensis]AKM07719.1 AMP-dependent synthetase/ligase [Pelagerythrobacter marensis]
MTADRSWPACTIAEAEAALTAPGAPWEMRSEAIGGRTLRTYVHGPRDMRRVIDDSRAYGDREFLIYREERVTFEAHWRAVQAFGRTLAEDFGVAKGDRVAVAMRNYPEWSVCAFAAMAIGAVLVPLNAWETGENLAAMIDASGAKVVAADAERLERLAGQTCSAQQISVRAGGGTGSFEQLVGPVASWGALAPLPAPDRKLTPDDPVAISFTSGTTGAAKGALTTHRMVLTNLANTQYRVARAALRRGDTWPPRDRPAGQQTVLLPLPLFHVTGLHSALIPALSRGNRLMLMYRWNLDEALALIQREQVNILILVPTLVVQLVQRLPAGGTKGLESVHTVTYGGSPAASDLAEGVISRFPGAAPAQGYGATETSSLVASNSHEDLLERPDSVGTAVPCCDVRVVDDAGCDVPRGTAGELWVRGPQVFGGYWGEEEATARVLSDGWYRTGDIVRMDEEGFLFVLDRKKDIVIRGGENVYCAEVEAAIARIPGVLDCAVFGVPDTVMGEIVAASVVVGQNSALTERDIRDALSNRLSAFKIPERVTFSCSALPRNAAGKVIKRDLRASVIAASAPRKSSPGSPVSTRMRR